jgi:hypothetical protein
MTDSPPTLTRHEALTILDPDGTGMVQVLALSEGSNDAKTWRGVVKLASVEPPQAPNGRRRVLWREVTSAEASSAEEAIALAVASYRRGRVARFDRGELAGVYEAAYHRSTAKLASEREADAAEALARHATMKALAEISRLGADVDRLRLALQGLADAANVALFEDVTWVGAPVPPALLEALHQAERAARSALAMAEPSPGPGGQAP